MKASIQEDFLKAPAKFDISTAAKRLSDVTIEGGYHICSPKDEITADQYIDISRMLDTQRLPCCRVQKKRVDLALSAPEGRIRLHLQGADADRSSNAVKGNEKGASIGPLGHWQLTVPSP
ncbi:hypothetical protein [Pseudomonas aeruginosa]|uniref:hypothetical protein n=1 Tax=Pseudomonas aeruginosa TaxID=287 RepID=UPI00197D8CD6|nr:hypothetical protein [Pseudomonas aeruginosa]